METIQEVSPTLDRSTEPDAGTVANPGKPQVRRLRRADSETITITVDGVPMACHAGETVATAILARRCWISFDGRRRGLLCGIGLCFECVVTVDGLPGTRACMARVTPGMAVATGPNGSPDGAAGAGSGMPAASPAASSDDPRSRS